MTAHIDDELPRLLSGEADRATVEAAAEHLRGCEDCQQELVSALVAHASLSSAARFAPDAATPVRLVDGPPAELPDLSSVFARVRAEAARAPTRRWRTRWLAAATVAGLAIGAGAVTVAENAGSGPSGRTVALAAYDRGRTSGTAKISRDEMRVDATSLPSLPQGKRYEVWLTDAERKHLQPLGWVGTNGKTDLTVPPDLMNQFSAVEVSVQDVNAPYQYSGVSVLRGTYR
jgi:hypothetical protein